MNSTPKPRKRDKEAKIQKIVETTRQMIEERGYLATTTNHIAKAANLSVALLYKYFPEGKPAILRAIFQGEREEPLDEERFSNLTVEDLPQYLERLLLENIRTHRVNARIIISMDLAYLSHKELFQDYLELNKCEVTRIVSALKYVQSLGYSHPDLDLEMLSSAIFQMVDSLVHRHVNITPVLPTDEELAHFLTDTILRILGIPD